MTPNVSGSAVHAPSVSAATIGHTGQLPISNFHGANFVAHSSIFNTASLDNLSSNGTYRSFFSG
jgi:hypothetical protein